MNYQHHWLNGERINLPAGKSVCVGRNYAAHIRELNNPSPDEPVLFIKPLTAMTDLRQPVRLPRGRGEVHHEVEVCLLIGDSLAGSDPSQAVIAVGLGLDLTLRDVQSRQKERGLPWEVAKAFDGSCPLSGFVPIGQIGRLDDLTFSLSVNGQLRQQGNTGQMLTRIPQLLGFISQHFSLLPGDIVMTGTPAGVGPLCPGDQLELALDPVLSVHTQCL